MNHHAQCQTTTPNDPGCFVNCYADNTMVVLTIIHEHGRSSYTETLHEAWERLDTFERAHGEYLSYDMRLDAQSDVMDLGPLHKAPNGMTYRLHEGETHEARIAECNALAEDLDRMELAASNRLPGGF